MNLILETCLQTLFVGTLLGKVLGNLACEPVLGGLAWEPVPGMAEDPKLTLLG